MKTKGLFYLFFLVYIHGASAQKGWEIGPYIGVMHYFGDLNTEYSLNDPGPAIGLTYRKNFNDRVGVQTMGSFGRIKAFDSDSNNSFEQNRNLSFESWIFDVAAHIEFNFFPYQHNKEYYFTPYAFLGVAATRYNPKTEFDGEMHTLRQIETEGVNYGQFTGGLSFGLGFKWDISRKWSFNAFLTPKNPWSDYIDDVSGVYPDFGDNQSLAASLSDRSGIPGFAEVGGQRGNSRNNDSYATFGLSIMRYFSRLECPKVSRIPKIKRRRKR